LRDPFKELPMAAKKIVQKKVKLTKAWAI